jgi:broad specificity phosphatase PhoE
MRLIFMRHGDTGYSWGVFVGSSDVDVKPEALDKARKAGKDLKQEEVKAIYTSELRRAWKTADVIGKELGIQPVRIRELNEMDYGKWELKHKDDIKRESPELWEQRKRLKWKFRFPGGESPDQFGERVFSVLSKIIREHQGETVLLVVHGALMKVSYSTFLNLEVGAIKDVSIDPLGMMVFKSQGDKFILEKTRGFHDG